MKVLVTGGGGQLGRALIHSSPEHVELIACTHAELDIADERSVSGIVQQSRPQVILNAAAYTAVDKAESEPDIARAINADGPGYLARAAAIVGARLIHVSTDFVFDGTASRPYQPSAPTNPLSVYGATKLAGEHAVLDILPDRSVIVRTAWVYAATGQNFVRTMLRLLQAKGSVRVVADQIGTPTAAQSLAQAIWKIVATPALTGIHHWRDAGVASWYDFAVAIAEEGAAAGLLPNDTTVVPIPAHEYPTPACRPRFSVLDTASLALLDIEPVHWRKRLRRVLEEIRNG